MTAEIVQPLIEPDAAQMRQHVEHLFGGWLDGCHDGRIELAWCDGKDGKLRHAAIFGSDGLDELVERAVQVNRIPGQNVYIGQALRKPDIPPFGRCTDADFFGLSTHYVDLDDDVLKTARERYRQAGCLPTAVVVTGRQPHTRAQLLWRLEIPERDADLCRRQNLALAEALGGDTTVVNPSRVLRLGGSIAWPAKPGRASSAPSSIRSTTAGRRSTSTASWRGPFLPIRQRRRGQRRLLAIQQNHHRDRI